MYLRQSLSMGLPSLFSECILKANITACALQAIYARLNIKLRDKM